VEKKTIELKLDACTQAALVSLSIANKVSVDEMVELILKEKLENDDAVEPGPVTSVQNYLANFVKEPLTVNQTVMFILCPTGIWLTGTATITAVFAEFTDVDKNNITPDSLTYLAVDTVNDTKFVLMSAKKKDIVYPTDLALVGEVYSEEMHKLDKLFCLSSIATAWS